MNDTEVLELSPNNLPAALLKTTVKERQNIADIIRDYGHRLQGFIRKRVKSTEDAEDILQEVYFQLAEADRLLKPIDQMAAWLFTVARNRITDLYRKKKTASLTEFFGSDEDEHSISEIKELILTMGPILKPNICGLWFGLSSKRCSMNYPKNSAWFSN